MRIENITPRNSPCLKYITTFSVGQCQGSSPNPIRFICGIWEVNHDILIARLRKDYDLSDSVIKWFDSYLRDRDQKVMIGDAFSDGVALESGPPKSRAVAQGHTLDM